METSQTIEKWGRETFGEAELNALALRAKEELEELIAAIKAGESHADIVAEAADVTILLHRLTGTLNMELSKAVEAKMIINRAREWTRSGDGTGQHK
jgi:NTP pyrophosphatase (non-canonical NTP hydrolase)